VLSAVATVITYFVWYRADDGVFERVPPIIRVAEQENFKGIGLGISTVKIAVGDVGAGLDEVIVRLEQHRERIDLTKSKFSGEKSGEVVLEVGGEDYFGEEGSGNLEIKVWDKSFWSNSSELVIPIKIDRTYPKVSVLTSQHNGQLGGSQLVFYRSTDANLNSSGVLVSRNYFKGAKAGLIDPAIRNPDVFAVFYGLDAASSIKETSVKLFARDEVGNEKHGNFYNKIAKRSFRQAREVVPSFFLERMVKGLTAPYKNELGLLADDSGLAHFSLLVSKIREIEEARIKSVIRSRGLTKLFIDSGMLPPPGAPSFRYGEFVKYVFNEQPVVEIRSTGFRLDVASDLAVFASATGEVILAENLSFFGKTVVVDHGMGITTTYSGLNSVLVSPGDLVNKDTAIGTSGMSGAFYRPGIYFEVRVQGVPVTPLEWWEGAWVKSHVLDKIKEIKRLLGAVEINPLE
jgi:hypothetical protein